MLKSRLAVVALLALALPVIAQPPGGIGQPLQPAAPVGRPADPALNPVPTDAFMFLSVKASKLWDNPVAKPFRDWVASQKEGSLETVIGISPADVDRATLFVPAANDHDLAPLLLITTRKPYNEARVLKALDVVRLANGRFAKLENRPLDWVVLVDERTLLFLPRTYNEDAGPALIGQLIARKDNGPLAAALLDAQIHDFTLGMDVRGFSEMIRLDDRPNKKLTPFLTLFKAKTITITADFDRTAKIRVSLAFPDADSAKRAGPVLEEGMKAMSDLFAHEKERSQSEPAEKIAFGWAITVMKNAKVSVDGVNVVATADVPYQEELGKAVAAMPKSIAIARANAKAINNLKQLGIAFFNFESAMGNFPGDVFGGDKPPAWSWRVQILPYIEQANLYQQLDLTKPWDDPANLKKLEAMEMPKVFEIPGRPAPKGHTYFRVFTLPKNAKGTDRPFFKEGERGPRISEITDGTSNTLMIVEAGEAVPWYKPDVLAYDGKLPLPQLGDKEADLFLAAMGDGSVRSLRPKKLGENTLRALITINGGEVVPNLDK